MSIHNGHRQRLKQRYLKAGLDDFDEINVLEMLLFYALPRQDTNPLAHELLARFGSLCGVMDAPVSELSKVPGVGEHAAILLHLVNDVARFYFVCHSRTENILHTTEKCGAYLSSFFFGLREEAVYLLCLDAKCKVLDCQLISRGSTNWASVPIRKIVEVALTTNATSCVLAHNHTSGIALPSKEDEATTLLVEQALNTVGVLLADHIVVADDDFVSMADNGFFRHRNDGR